MCRWNFDAAEFVEICMCISGFGCHKAITGCRYLAELDIVDSPRFSIGMLMLYVVVSEILLCLIWQPHCYFWLSQCHTYLGTLSCKLAVVENVAFPLELQ